MRHSALFLAFLGTLLIQSNPAHTESKSGTRWDEIFVWMVSEKLQLKPQVESEFSETFKDLNRKKSELTTKTDQHVEVIRTEKDPQKLRKAIDEYRVNLQDLGQIQVQEVEKLSRILGDQKFSQYLGLKQELGKKVKELK